MSVADIIREHRLAALSAGLGLLANIVSFAFLGAYMGFTYLGIPAIVIGVICLMRESKLRNLRHPPGTFLAIAGIVLGVMPIILTFLGIL
ncbi:MAG TPA: hypothetical protein VMT91_04025 [Anaerolineales bacterium]|nr:hypothetical protein [Anaerolineales bacterium]